MAVLIMMTPFWSHLMGGALATNGGRTSGPARRFGNRDNEPKVCAPNAGGRGEEGDGVGDGDEGGMGDRRRMGVCGGEC